MLVCPIERQETTLHRCLGETPEVQARGIKSGPATRGSSKGKVLSFLQRLDREQEAEPFDAGRRKHAQEESDAVAPVSSSRVARLVENPTQAEDSCVDENRKLEDLSSGDHADEETPHIFDEVVHRPVKKRVLAHELGGEASALV